jgi:hypothetical protein
VRRKPAALIGAAALLASAVPAAASTVEDDSGDTGGFATSGPSIDILEGYAGKGARGKLVHTVELDGAADPNRMPLILIERTDEQSRWCDFVVGRTDYGTGVFECGYMNKVGSVRIKRSGSKVTYTFSRKAIGNLSEYGWAVVTRGESSGSTVEYDRAPSEPDTFVAYR